MKARRLLHVFATFSRGGPQVRAVQLMARMGREFAHTVVPMDGQDAAGALVPEGVDWELQPPPPRSGTLATVRALAARMRSLAPDLVLTYNWGAIEAVWAANRLRLPVVHHEEGFGPQELDRRLRRRNWARRILLRKVQALIVPSRGLQQIARQEWRVPEGRVSHLPNGVDLQRFCPRSGSRPGPGVIGSVGRLRPEKDHALLLRAFAAMRASGWRLRLLGDGPLDRELRNLAETLEVRDRVEFCGAVFDPAPSYRDMEVFALPSQTEQMPLSLLEAMASGLPVVATDVGDVARMLPPEQGRRLVRPGDVPAFAAALDELAADPERRAREGQRNRAWVAERFELGACLDRYRALYERALAVRR